MLSKFVGPSWAPVALATLPPKKEKCFSLFTHVDEESEINCTQSVNSEKFPVVLQKKNKKNTVDLV